MSCSVRHGALRMSTDFGVWVALRGSPPDFGTWGAITISPESGTWRASRISPESGTWGASRISPDFGTWGALRISPELGSWGNCQVYLGKWHNSECAVKCLNQSLFFSDGPGGQVSMAAITDLIHEADLLGGLRHPNVVWVYGIVLPRLDDSDGSGCKVSPSPLPRFFIFFLGKSHPRFLIFNLGRSHPRFRICTMAGTRERFTRACGDEKVPRHAVLLLWACSADLRRTRHADLRRTCSADLRWTRCSDLHRTCHVECIVHAMLICIGHATLTLQQTCHAGSVSGMLCWLSPWTWPADLQLPWHADL